MDNRCVDVVSAGERDLSLALELATRGRSITHYLQEDGDLVLLNGPEPQSTALVAPLLTSKQVADFVWSWLSNIAEPKERLDDPDVLNEEGAFRVWSVENARGVCRVQARYAWLGK